MPRKPRTECLMINALPQFLPTHSPYLYIWMKRSCVSELKYLSCVCSNLISPAFMPLKRSSLTAIPIKRVDLYLPRLCLLQDKRGEIRSTERVSVAWQGKFFSLQIITKLLKIKLFFISNELCMSCIAIKISKVVLRANVGHKYQLVFVIFS